LFSDSGHAAASNQDGSSNSPNRAAAAGSVIALYGTGLGDPTQPVTVRIGDQNAEVLYVGSANGLPGVFQINARVPGNLTAGSVPVQVLAGDGATQVGLTVSVY
jgi:uncharacterized protein (TIGR03437 family)